MLCVNLKKVTSSHQPSLDVSGPYIIGTLLLFQCFRENDHHGNAQLCSSLFRCRRRPRAAILDEGGGQIVHLETDDRLATSHLRSSPQVLMMVVVGGSLSHFS